MKKRVICFVLSLLIISIPAVPADAQVINNEWDMAYALIQNWQNGNATAQVACTSDLQMNRVWAYAASVIPSKTSISRRYVTYSNGYIEAWMYLEVQEPYQAEAAAAVKRAADSIVNASMTNLEKIRTFHDYLILNCAYDSEARSSRMNAASMPAFSTSGPMLFGKAVCDGYASAMMALCEYAGVPCFKISSTSMDHAWNYVFDGGQWLHADVTYDDPTPDTPGRIKENYFMKTTSEMRELGHVLDESTEKTLSFEEYTAFFAWYLEKTGYVYSSPQAGEQTVYISEEELRRQLYAKFLEILGLFSGTENGYELKRTPNRLEMAVMFSRVLGAEQKAASSTLTTPFCDTGWAYRYVAYLYHAGYIKGIGAGIYGGYNSVSAKDYITLMLRALGYSDERGDFSWEDSLEYGLSLGVVSEGIAQGASFSRGDMAEVTVYALHTNMKGTNTTLAEYLMRSGTISAKAYLEAAELLEQY